MEKIINILMTIPDILLSSNTCRTAGKKCKYGRVSPIRKKKESRSAWKVFGKTVNSEIILNRRFQYRKIKTPPSTLTAEFFEIISRMLYFPSAINGKALLE